MDKYNNEVEEFKNPYTFLRDEINNELKRYDSFCKQKILLSSSLLGIGNSVTFAFSNSGIIDISSLFLAIPFIGLAYDTYIVSADFRIKRIGDFIAESKLDTQEKIKPEVKMIQCWERYVNSRSNPFSSKAFIPSTVAILIVSVLSYNLHGQNTSYFISFFLITGIILLTIGFDIYLAEKSYKARSKHFKCDIKTCDDIKNGKCECLEWSCSKKNKKNI